MRLERRLSEVGQLLTETAASAGSQAASTSPFLFGAPPLGLRSAGHAQTALECLAQQGAPQQGSLQRGGSNGWLQCFSSSRVPCWKACEAGSQPQGRRVPSWTAALRSTASRCLPTHRQSPSRSPPALSARWPCCAHCCAAWLVSTPAALLGRLVWDGRACCRPGLARGGCPPCLRPVRGCWPCRLLRSQCLLAGRVLRLARQIAGGGRAPRLHCKGLPRIEKRFEDQAQQTGHMSHLGRTSGLTASKAR